MLTRKRYAKLSGNVLRFLSRCIQCAPKGVRQDLRGDESCHATCATRGVSHSSVVRRRRRETIFHRLAVRNPGRVFIALTVRPRTAERESQADARRSPGRSKGKGSGFGPAARNEVKLSKVRSAARPCAKGRVFGVPSEESGVTPRRPSEASAPRRGPSCSGLAARRVVERLDGSM